MASIRTFEIPWPVGPARNITVVGPPQTITVALGTTGPNSWFLINLSRGEDGMILEDDAVLEDVEYLEIAAYAVEEPFPVLSANGNPVFALKNYSANEGILERLLAVGMIQHTGRRITQGFVQLDMVEVLVPKEELIKRCDPCEQWEVLGKPRYRKCSRCRMRYFCSKDCQKEDWKEHKHVCKIGMTEEEFRAEKAKEITIGDIMARRPFAGSQTLNRR